MIKSKEIKLAKGIGFGYWKTKTMFRKQTCDWQKYTIHNIIILIFHIKITVYLDK